MRQVGNHGLNYVGHNEHDAHHRSRNFEKAKMSKINCKSEKFENTVNLIYTVCAMSEMMSQTMLAIMSMMRITIKEISKKSICRTKKNFEKFENTVNLIYTMCAM